MKILKILYMENYSNIIVTGGSGTLGTELKKLMPDACFPSSNEFDITNYNQMDKFLEKREYAHFCTMIHCAAFISPPKINLDPIRAIETNIIGTANIVKLCNNYSIKLIYISTDYVFDGKTGNYKEDDPVNPINKYAWSKLGGECAVKLYDNSLIIRLSFGPKIFPYEAAFIDQWTSRESVDKIAIKILSLLNTSIYGVIHIGQDEICVYDYAKSLDTQKEIKKISIKDVSFNVPENTSLNIDKYKNIFK